MDIKKQADRLPDKPARMEIKFEAIPQELKARAQWVLWRWEFIGKDWTKPPFQINGKHSSHSDPSTWASFENVVVAYKNGKGWDGVGYVLTKDDFYTGVDLDGAYDKDAGRLRDWGKPIVSSLNTYTEISPSGEGLKSLLKGKLPKGGHHKDGKIGVFDRARYFCVTGQTLDGLNKIEERQPELDALVRQEWPQDFESDGPLFEQPPAEPETAAPLELTKEDFDIYDRAGNAKNGEKFMKLWDGKWEGDYPSQSEADDAMVALLAFWTKDRDQIDRLFRASGLMRDKWGKRADYRKRSLDRALKLTADIEPKEQHGEPPVKAGAKDTAARVREYLIAAGEKIPGFSR